MHNLPTQENSDLKFFASLALVLVVFFSISYFVGKGRGDDAVVENLELSPSAFDNIELTAKAAYVYDSRTHTVLYAENEDKRLPLASLTKVMSALVASELARPDSTLAIPAKALEETGDSGLHAGEEWSLQELLDFSLTSSSNDGMQAVALALGAARGAETHEDAEANFVLIMNDKAEALGMKNTYYWNATGLDESNVKGGAYGTAKDMAILFDHVLRYKPSLLDATREEEVTLTSLDDKVHVAENTSYIVSDIPGIKASKTGFTDIAGGNLVVAFDPEVGRPVIIAVLGSTADGRFSDVLALMEASIQYLQQ